jgi:GGDEF domain-containing protein
MICISVDVDDMHRVNQARGYSFGDKALEKIASMLRGLFLQHATEIRHTSDEFVLFIEGLSTEQSKKKMARCERQIASTCSVRISYGIGTGYKPATARRMSMAALFSSKRASSRRQTRTSAASLN